MEVSPDEGVYAARIGGQRSAVPRRKRSVRVFGDAPHAQEARAAIGIESRWADDFGKVAGGQAAQAIHLEETILRGGVALREIGVVLASGRNVRHTECVARDRDSLRNRSRNGARSLGQR